MSIIYHPPIWALGGMFSAEDDRRLVKAAFAKPGVIGIDDLRVLQRQEGANMSVDVLPGTVVIPGNDYPDQGTYICTLRQRINVEIETPRPEPGMHRREYVQASLYEQQGEVPYWRVHTVPASPAPTSVADPPFDPILPASTVMLANIVPISATTPGITQGIIYDFRHYARPANLGDSVLDQAALPTGVGPYGGGARWGPRLRVWTPPAGPLDIELRVEGTVASTNNALAVGQFSMNLKTRLAGGWDGQSPWVTVTSMRSDDHRAFSRSLIARNVNPVYPDQFYAEAAVRSISGYSALSFMNGVLTMRISPSGSGLSW